MVAVVTERGFVHYEVVGRGQPVILLHGWIGSWGLWHNTMDSLGDRFRCYAPEFWGFGSTSNNGGGFQIDDFVEMVDKFMDRLGIDSAPIIGHSMGGTVALSLALNKPERVKQIIVVGSPIVGKSLSLWLRISGQSWAAKLLWKFPILLNTFLKLYAYQITNKPSIWYDMVIKDVSSTTLDSFFRSISSLHKTDLTTKVHEIDVPILGIYGEQDVVVAPAQAQVLTKNIPHAKTVLLPDSGHFPMLDELEIFNDHLRYFLVNQDMLPNHNQLF